jgi:hypothetical protein
MDYFPLRREFQIAYLLVGAVFLGVSASLWLEGIPSEEGFWTFLHVARNLTVSVLGILLILRPLRSRVGIDARTLLFADGIMPERRIALERIAAIYSDRDRRMIVYLGTGQRVFIDYNFTRIDELLARLATKGILVLDRPLKKRAR